MDVIGAVNGSGRGPAEKGIGVQIRKEGIHDFVPRFGGCGLGLPGFFDNHVMGA